MTFLILGIEAQMGDNFSCILNLLIYTENILMMMLIHIKSLIKEF